MTDEPPRIPVYNEHGEPFDKVIRLKDGTYLTEEKIQALADEAERGYDVSHLIGKPSRRTMPDEIEPPEHEPEVVLECDSCEWTYLSDGSIPDDVLQEIMEQHREAVHK